MRLLADENIHPIVVQRLRSAGFEVEWIKESSRGALDADILHRSDIATVVFITSDRDFGDLIFNRGLPTPAAILYSRLPHSLLDLTADRLVALLEAGVATGQMTTITKDGTRTKPFPLGAADA